MAWTRRQKAAVSIIPVLAVVWIGMRVIRSPRPEPVDEPAVVTETAAAQPAPSDSTTVPAPRETPPPTSMETVTDARGRFQLRGLAPGAYRVTFGEPGERSYTTLDGVQVNDLYGANLLNLRLRSGSDGVLGSDEYQPNKLPRVIRGNVVGAKDAPLAGIKVRAERR
jgi:hypothetical protein